MQSRQSNSDQHVHTHVLRKRGLGEEVKSLMKKAHGESKGSLTCPSKMKTYLRKNGVDVRQITANQLKHYCSTLKGGNRSDWTLNDLRQVYEECKAVPTGENKAFVSFCQLIPGVNH